MTVKNAVNSATKNASKIIPYPESQVSLEEAFLRMLTTPTQKEYRRALRSFASFLGKPLLAASRRDIESFVAHLRDRRRSPSTINKVLSALSGFYRYAYDEEVITRNPAASVRRPRLPDCSPRRGLTPAEIKSLFDATDAKSLIGYRDRALLTVLACQGLRISEALGISIHDFAEEQGHKVAEITGKGGKVSRIPLAAATWTAIQSWLTASGIEEGPVFVPVTKSGKVITGKAISPQSAWERTRILGRRAGLTRSPHPHLFRHSNASLLLAKGVRLHEVQLHLRHANPATSMRYDTLRKTLANPSPHVMAAELELG